MMNWDQTINGIDAEEFTCPECGGTHFGRDTKSDAQGIVRVLDTVRCHDEHGKGCAWKGEWPQAPTG